MDEHAMTDSASTKLSGPDVSTKLALDRTQMAHERTQMAWLRTSMSLISFGFTIQKFFEIEHKEFNEPHAFFGAGNFGRLMVVSGLIILVISTLDHRKQMRAFREEYPSVPAERSLAGWLSAMIAVLGVVAMISVMTRG